MHYCTYLSLSLSTHRTIRIRWGGIQAQPMRHCARAIERKPIEGSLRNESGQNNHSWGPASTTCHTTAHDTCTHHTVCEEQTFPHSLPPSLTRNSSSHTCSLTHNTSPTQLLTHEGGSGRSLVCDMHYCTYLSLSLSTHRTIRIRWGGIQAQPMRHCARAIERKPIEGSLRNESGQNNHSWGPASTTCHYSIV